MADPGRKGEPPEEEEYHVAPPDPAVRQREPMPLGPPYDGYLGDEPAKDEPFQFSLAELLMLVTVVAVLCSVVKILPGERIAANLALFLGLAVLAGMVVMHVLDVTRPIVRLGWWVGLGLYLAACIAAIVRR